MRLSFLPVVAGLCLIALTVPAYRWLDAERANVGAVPRAIEAQGTATRTFLSAELQKLRSDTMAEIDRQASSLRHDLRAESAAWRVIVDGRLANLTNVADARLASVEQTADRHLDTLEGMVAAELARAGDQVEQIGAEVQATLVETRGTIHDVRPHAIGATAAAKVALGETAKAMRTVDQRLPEFLDKFQGLLDTFQKTNTTIERWVGFETKPSTKKQTAVALVEKLAVLAARLWLLL